MSLKSIPTEKIRVHPDTVATLWRKIQTMALPFDERYLHFKHRWSFDFSAGAIREYRRFAFLALVSRTMVTPSESVDEVWHCHILHTKEYERFGELCGMKLHHMPGMPNEREKFQPNYDLTHELYRDFFGEHPPRLYWPRGDQCPEPISTGGSVGDVLRAYLGKHAIAA